MGINIGKYDQRILVQNWTESRNLDGSASRSFSTLYTLWAKVTPKGGNEVNQSDEKTAVKRAIFEVRANGVTLNETMRITWRNEVYNITNVSSNGTRLKEVYIIEAIAKDNS